MHLGQSNALPEYNLAELPASLWTPDLVSCAFQGLSVSGDQPRDKQTTDSVRYPGEAMNSILTIQCLKPARSINEKLNVCE